ncbi:MAG: 2-octaprenyl-6-methoxyphenyl hydroxylase [Enterovibrio sp.]
MTDCLTQLNPLNHSAAMVPHFDVVIAGGAMTGATLALALSKLTHGKLAIAVIEAQSAEELTQDPRSIALALGSCQALTALDLWQALSPLATAIQTIHVSEQQRFGMASFCAKEQRLAYFGQVIPIGASCALLHEKMRRDPAITLFEQEKITAIKRTKTCHYVTLSSNIVLKASLFVAADGANSDSLRLQGINRQLHDFKQVAIIADLQTEISHQNAAFERFTPSGPLALLPLHERHASLVWCTSAQQAQALLALPNKDFLHALQQAFGWRLGRFLSVSQRASYPLALSQAEHLVNHRFVAIGNAAQTLHPVAGQGFNLALRDAVTLAKSIAAAKNAQQDFASMHLLQSYLQQRHADRQAVMCLISSLVYGFSNTAPLLSFARNALLLTMSHNEQLFAPLRRTTLGVLFELKVD